MRSGSPVSFGFVWIHSGPHRYCRVLSWFCRVLADSLSASSGRLVYSCSRVFNQVRIGVIGFIRVRLCLLRTNRCRRVHSGSLGFTQRALLSPGSFSFAWIYSGAPKCRRVHSGSCGFSLSFPFKGVHSDGTRGDSVCTVVVSSHSHFKFTYVISYY